MDMSHGFRALPLFRIVCAGVVGVLLLGVGGYFFIYPLLTPHKIRGDIIDCAIVPQKGETNRLWILTDGSFNYISSTKTPGRHSVGRRCLSCKAWMYEYDPVSGKVINKIEVKYADLVLNAWIFYSKGTIYHVAGAYRKGEARVLTYDAGTGAMAGDTRSFISGRPELAGGIIKARYDESKRIIEFDTRDGKTSVVYSPEDDKVYPSYSSFSDEQKKDTKETVMQYLCSEDGNAARKLLYRASGPRWQLSSRRSVLEGRCSSRTQRVSSHMKSIAVEQTADTVFLHGTMYHQDDEGSIIIYVDQAGKKADRIMTCVDREGKIKWTVPQSEMFGEMKIDEDRNIMTRVDLSRDKIRVMRSGNLVVLRVYQVGLMGFDYRTGKKIFTVN